MCPRESGGQSGPSLAPEDEGRRLAGAAHRDREKGEGRARGCYTVRSSHPKYPAGAAGGAGHQREGVSTLGSPRHSQMRGCHADLESISPVPPVLLPLPNSRGSSGREGRWEGPGGRVRGRVPVT